jgi:hypothetical protein
LIELNSSAGNEGCNTTPVASSSHSAKWLVSPDASTAAASAAAGAELLNVAPNRAASSAICFPLRPPPPSVNISAVHSATPERGE